MTTHYPPGTTCRRRSPAAAAMTAAGYAHGSDAAAWWQQDNLGACATGDVTATARRVLDGINDLDPQIIDALPQPCLEPPHLKTTYDAYAHRSDPAWEQLSQAARELARQAYLVAFDAALQDTIAGYCRDLLEPR